MFLCKCLISGSKSQTPFSFPSTNPVLTMEPTTSSCRRSDNNLNIFTGVHRNPWFIMVQLVTWAGQIAIIFKGGDAFQTAPLTGAQWGWTFLFGALTLPLGAAIRCIPDPFLLAIARRFRPLTRLVTKYIRFRRGEKVNKGGVQDAEGETAGGFFEDLTNDEERKIRRFQWRSWSRTSLGSKRARSSDGVTVAMASAGLEVAGRNMVVRFQRQTSREAMNATGVGAAGGEQPSIDIHRWIETAKNTPAECPYGLEVHPATGKSDPVLMTAVIEGRIPPSQDKEVKRYLGI